MWLVTTLMAALVTTLLWFWLKGRYKLGFLSLMLWGATIMILVDHILGYEGGRFIETETEGMINNAGLLGMVMLIPVLLIWFMRLSLSGSKRSKLRA
jgi:hypothetical protein